MLFVEERAKKLNKIEKIKNSKEPMEFFNQLEEFAKEGSQRFSKEDREFFLKCFGIYDKTREEGEDNFMIRIRIPKGNLTTSQAKVIGEIAKEYGRNHIDLTTRMQIEIRYFKIKDIPTILKKLESVSITTFQTGTDNIRNIVTDPLDGVAKDSFIETKEYIEEMEKLFLKREEWIGKLPRKFNISISGSLTNRCNVYGHDCCFVLAKKGNEYGFNLYLGGKVGVIAESANLFIKRDEVVEVFEKVVNLYKKYGFRDNRNRNRLHYLLKEVGIEKFVEAINQNKKYQEAGETICNRSPNDREGVIELKENSALQMIIPTGILSGDDLIEIAKVAEKWGDGNIRLTTTQNIFILNVKESLLALKEPIFQKYKNVDNTYFTNLISCIGSADCHYGLYDTKKTSLEIADYLTKNLPTDGKIRMHYSGCIKGCGLHGTADIGFIGSKTKRDGKVIEAVHILIGGNDNREGKIIHKSVPLDKIKEIITPIIEDYNINRLEGEAFSDYYIRVKG